MSESNRFIYMLTYTCARKLKIEIELILASERASKREIRHLLAGSCVRLFGEILESSVSAQQEQS